MGSLHVRHSHTNAQPADIHSAMSLLRESTDDTSQRQLERQVEQLSSELSRVDRARLCELEAKERVSERLQSLLDLLPGGVVVLDNRGVVVDCNPAAQDMLDSVLSGERWTEVIQRAFAPRKDDGHEISLVSGKRVSVATRSLDRGMGQVILLTDQTETRALQDRLSRHQRLTAMGRMMAALAHQIRTPLSAALLYASHLSERELNPEQTQKFSGKIASRLHHMERQIRDMLIFVRGEVPLTDVVTAAQLVASIESAVEVALEGHQASLLANLLCDPDLVITCNHDAVIGAVANLVNNALQAQGQGAQIDLELDDDAHHLRISVHDQGPGMDAKTLAALSDPFFTTKAKGNGLGLAVARSVARAHGGDVRVESEVDVGTTVTLSISLVPAEQGAAA